MAAASKPDLDHLFTKIGEKLGWFKYDDLDSAIQSLSKSARTKSTKSRLCLKKSVKQETDGNSSEKGASTKKIQKAKLILDDSSSHGSNSGDDADLFPKKSQKNCSSTKICFAPKTSTKKIRKARLTLDDSHSSNSSDEADLFSYKTKGNSKNNTVSKDVSKKVLHGKNEVGFSSPRQRKEKEKCSLVMKSKPNGQMLENFEKMKLVDDSLRVSDEFIAPQECKRKQFTSDIENGWNNSQFELSPDLQDFGDPLTESTRIHRRSSVTYHKILNVSGISSTGSVSIDDQELSDSIFQSDDTYKQMPQGYSTVGKPVGCDYQRFLVPSNRDIVQTLDSITLDEFYTVSETKDEQTGIRQQELVIQETVNEVSKGCHFVTVEDSLLEKETPISCSGSSTHRIQSNFSQSSSKQSLPGLQVIPDSESEDDNNKGDILFREHIHGHGRQLLLDKNDYLLQEKSEKSVNITGNNYNSLSFSQDHKTPDKLLPDISLPKFEDNNENSNLPAKKLSEKKTKEDISSSLDSHNSHSQSGNENFSTEMGISIDNTCNGENGSWYEVADVSIQCNISCKSLILSSDTLENYKGFETCHASSQLNESHIGDDNIGNNTNYPEGNSVDIADVHVNVNDEDESVYEVVDVSVQTDNPTVITDNSYYYKRESDDDNDGSAKLLTIDSGLHGSDYKSSVKRLETGLSSVFSAESHESPSMFCTSMRTPDEKLKRTLSLNITKKHQNVLRTSGKNKQLQSDTQQKCKRKKAQADETIYFDAVSDTDQVELPSTEVENNLPEEDGSDLGDGERKKIYHVRAEEGDSDLEDGERKKIGYDGAEEGESDLEDGERKKIIYDGAEEGDSDLEDGERKKIIYDMAEEGDSDLEDGERKKIIYDMAEEGDTDLEDGERRKIGFDGPEKNGSAPKKNPCRGVVIQPSADENKNNWRTRRDYDSESSDDGLEAFFQKMRTPAQSKRGNSGHKKSRNSLKNFIVDDDEEISSMSDEEDELFYISTTRALETPRTESIKSKMTSYPSTTSDGSDGDFSSSVYPKSVTKHKRKNVTKASKSTKSATRQKKTNLSSSSNDSCLDTDESKHPRSSVKSSFNMSDIEYSDENFTEETFNKPKENNTAGSNSSSIPSAVLKSRVINTFVTPKSNPHKTAGVKNFKTPSLLTPKVPSCSDFSTKKTSAAGGTLNFLQSLSSDADDYRRHSDAIRFITSFNKYKEELSSKLLRLFNESVFDGQLPSDLPVIWNKRLLRTAGYCAYKYSASNSQAQRSARIELSTKVCDSAERVRDTLIHEMCHAAVWLLNGAKDGHGPYWKYWAKKANMAHPEIPVVARCHNYSISTKYIYRCTKCGYSIGRHSKSLDTERKVCGYCHGNFELLSSKSTSSTPSVPGGTPTPVTPRTPNKFAIFVKENYNEVKKTDKYLKHGDVMKILSKQFAEMKMNLECI